jgi:hypothetical protein
MRNIRNAAVRSIVSGFAVIAILSVMGTILTAKPAIAQVPIDVDKAVTYGPIDLGDANIEAVRWQGFRTSVLLPAVQKAGDAVVRIQVIGDNLNWTIPVGGATTMSSRSFSWGIGTNELGGKVLKVKDLKSGETLTKTVQGTDFTVRFLPAVQKSGQVTSVLSSSLLLNGIGVSTETPIVVALPAVQKTN